MVDNNNKTTLYIKIESYNNYYLYGASFNKSNIVSSVISFDNIFDILFPYPFKEPTDNVSKVEIEVIYLEDYSTYMKEYIDKNLIIQKSLIDLKALDSIGKKDKIIEISLLSKQTKKATQNIADFIKTTPTKILTQNTIELPFIEINNVINKLEIKCFNNKR